MTLLGWMHRKLRSNNDVFKEFNTDRGGACNYITGLASPDHDYFGDDTFTANQPSPPVNADDLFTLGGSGLLTIGTLGFAAINIPGEHVDDEDYDIDDEDFIDVDIDNIHGTIDEVHDGDVTPTFTLPQLEAAAVEKVMDTVEAIAEKDDHTTTEDDLLLVSAELEKVLGGSNVPSTRVSFAMGVDCPLQGFLLGSPVSSDIVSRSEKPDGGGRRASLGELFMRTHFAEEKVTQVAVPESEDGGEREEVKAGKGGGGGHQRMKKRRVKDEKGVDGDGVPASAKTKSKFQKMLQIFHRKVYPECSTILTKKNRKPDNGGGGGEPVKRTGQPRMLSLGCCCTKRSFGASPGDDGGGELNRNKSGHWIKTDADYLVLEL